MRALLAGLALLGIAADPARAEDAVQPPPALAVPTYAEAIRCQAFYVVYASLLERGSDEFETAADVFDEWYDFTASHYPDDAERKHDIDLQTEVQRIDGELGQAANEDAAEKLMESYLDGCAAIEPFAPAPAFG
ncbi:MAG: hypothetical protein J7496_08225 [Novosphingobium sp.]|nr:hypothetical protein [Novosphingobium sp.]